VYPEGRRQTERERQKRQKRDREKRERERERENLTFFWIVAVSDVAENLTFGGGGCVPHLDVKVGGWGAEALDWEHPGEFY
jgi:hypothetical protein